MNDRPVDGKIINGGLAKDRVNGQSGIYSGCRSVADEILHRGREGSANRGTLKQASRNGRQ